MKLSLLLIAGVSFLTLELNAKTIFVKPEPLGNADGTSWNNAYGSLNTAVEAAAKGDEIWMAGGLYTVVKSSGNNGLVIQPQVSIFGGFSGTETSIDQRSKSGVEAWEFTNVTEIKGNENMRLIQTENNTGLTTYEPGIIDGVKITHNNTSTNRILWSRESSFIFQNCQFIGMGDNSSSLYFEDAKGGVQDCYFENCRNAIVIQTAAGANQLGYGSTVFVRNNVFKNSQNRSINIYNQLGGKNLTIPSAKIYNNKFIDTHIVEANPNTPNPNAACIYVNQGDDTRNVEIYENEFYNNHYEGYGGIIVFSGGGDINFNNNIVANNTATPLEGQTGYSVILGTHASGSTDARNLYNNLIVNNSAPRLLSIYGSYLFNNTVANNIGSISFSDFCMVWNNIFFNNKVDDIETGIRLEQGKTIVAMNNLLSKDYILTGVEDGPEDYITDNVVDSSNPFVNPSITEGVCDAHISNYNFSPSNSQNISFGTNEPFDYYDNSDFVNIYLGENATDISGSPFSTSSKVVGAYQTTNTGLGAIQSSRKYRISSINGGVCVTPEDGALIELFSLNGKLLDMKKSYGDPVTIHLNGGVYLLRITDNTISETHKVMIP